MAHVLNELLEKTTYFILKKRRVNSINPLTKEMPNPTPYKSATKPIIKTNRAEKTEPICEATDKTPAWTLSSLLSVIIATPAGLRAFSINKIIINRSTAHAEI